MATSSILPPAEPIVQTAPAKKRLPFMDSLRGLAALYVVCFHVAMLPSQQFILPDWLRPFIVNGATGVQLFFVISGFTMCLTQDARQHLPHSAYNFYIRRFFRIAPLYYAWLVLMIALTWGISFASFNAQKVYIALYALFGYNFVPGHQHGLVGASWTLSVEVVFYLFFPFLFKVVNTFQRTVLFFVATCLLSALHSFVITEYTSWLSRGYVLNLSLFMQLPVFVVGMATYFIYKQHQHSGIAGATQRLLLAAGVVGVIASPYIWHGLGIATTYEGFRNYLTAIIYACLFLGLAFQNGTFLVNRVWAFLGLISYSLYLNHSHLVGRLAPIYQKIYAMTGDDALTFLLCVLLTFALLLPISWLTYKLIEQPFEKLAPRFLRYSPNIRV